MAGVGGHGQYMSLTINGGRDARGPSTSCEGEGTGQDRPAQQRPHAGLACTGSSGGPCAGSRVRARSELQLEQAAQGRKERGSQRRKKSLGKKLEERNKMDLNKI
jgi:hypothetical protein